MENYCSLLVCIQLEEIELSLSRINLDYIERPIVRKQIMRRGVVFVVDVVQFSHSGSLPNEFM